MNAPGVLATWSDPGTLGLAQAHVDAIVKRSGTSFFWAMRLLPRAKREAMFAVYAFCREVDDIADGEASPAAKLAALAGWREEIAALFAGHPGHPITRALAEPVVRFGLARRDFEAMLEGMEMDAKGGMRAPSLAELERYCACVAGAVGHLSVGIFGATGEAARRLADCLGEAVQLTNVLRDLEEDVGMGRLYLPREILEAHGLPVGEPAAVLGHPRLPAASAELADVASRRFAEAMSLIRKLPRRQVRPALVMMMVYQRLLERLKSQGFRRAGRRIGLSKAEKFWIAVRYGLV